MTRTALPHLYRDMTNPFPLADSPDEREIPGEVLLFGPLLLIGFVSSCAQLSFQRRTRATQLDRIPQLLAIPMQHAAPTHHYNSYNPELPM